MILIDKVGKLKQAIITTPSTHLNLLADANRIALELDQIYLEV